jgi:uncharacterized CHY-type Zn-finger protein
MDCKAVQQHIFRLVYDEADPHELRKLQEHLAVCGACRQEQEIIESILKQLRECLCDDPLPEGCYERMKSNLEEVINELDKAS